MTSRGRLIVSLPLSKVKVPNDTQKENLKPESDNIQQRNSDKMLDKPGPSGLIQPSNFDCEEVHHLSDSSISYIPSQSAVSSEDAKAADSGEKFPKKRKRQQQKWKKSVRVNRRKSGKSYVGATGNRHEAKPMLPSPCLENQKHVTCKSISEENRRKIYEDFRGLSSAYNQKQFIKSHIEKKPKGRTTRNISDSRRQFTIFYYFTVESQKIKVCRQFFLATLNITDALIRNTIRKTNEQGNIQEDRRGKHVPHNKLSSSAESYLKKHITSFPAVESHYCRKSTGKKFLDSSLNMQVMHSMYVEVCKTDNVKPVGISKYRKTFRSYNLGFFKPKKDQCKRCTVFNTLSEQEKRESEANHHIHIERKNAARQERNKDKEIAKANEKVLAFNFDLEAVLTTPKGSAGQIFYLRKLAVYNLTVYNLGNQKVMCYLWDETQGKRGANEISSSIFNFILKHEGISAVKMMSDSCGGQQENSIFATMCLKILDIHPTLESIDHKFFETGHTEMECDSIHSKIEQKCKYTPVYTPQCWAQIIRSARKNPCPFEVESLTYEKFYDFKATSLNMAFQNIPWHRICWLRYEKTHPKTIFYKINFADDFSTIEIKFKKGRKDKKLEKAYKSDLPISDAKFKDLMKMCDDLTIPRCYHRFYNSIKADHSQRDCLPEPDFYEESEYESE